MALWIDQVERFREVDFLKQVVGEAPGVSRLDDEAVRQFASKRKVHHVGIGSFQVVIDSPSDSQAIGAGVVRRSVGKSVW